MESYRAWETGITSIVWATNAALLALQTLEPIRHSNSHTSNSGIKRFSLAAVLEGSIGPELRSDAC